MSDGPEVCEECDRRATHRWGMDLTPLCDEHYAEAERRYDAYAFPNQVQEADQ